MPFPCFLIEPVLDVQGSIPRDDDGWDPRGRAILGWKRADTGERAKHTHDFGVGAMWRAIWQPKNWDWDNETEPHLIVCCPNPDATSTRDWDIDSRASNCGSPKDKLHRCWVRRGIPPLITVDKSGLTCSAGAGSILLSKWHGFLKNGILTP